jgi:hypothetical protein
MSFLRQAGVIAATAALLASPAAAKPVASSAADIGVTKTIAGYSSKARVTLLGIKNPAPSTGILGPDAGKKFVAVKLRVTNLSARALDASSVVFGAEVVATSRVSYNPTFFGGVEPELSGRIARGDSRVGWMTFEMPRTAAPWKLQISLTFGDDLAVWRLR